jgi:hypothetical protein
MFTAAEALGLVMAVLEGHPKAGDPADPVGGALAKIVRVLPERVAGPARNVRDASCPGAADQYRRATSALSRRLLRAAGARADDGAAPDQRNASGTRDTSGAFARSASDSANRAG